ncbi:MAG: ParA family protein [Gammaproteobacteria bacterium]|nr:ParA family protein [Gammaproteobacteria bacterium]
MDQTLNNSKPMFTYRAKVLAIVNQKGGVGKSTITAVLAEYGAIVFPFVQKNERPRNARILVVDLDMQCNTSDYFVGMEPAKDARGGQLPPKHPGYDGSEMLSERSTIADIFYGRMVLPHTVTLKGKTGDVEIDVILAHPAQLEDINEQFDQASGEIDQRVVNRLGELLHHPEVADNYDLIILDTGPSRNPIFRAALRAATHVLIPYEPEEKSLQGVNSMVQAITNENFNRKKPAPSCKIVGLMPNKVRSTVSLHKNNIAKIKSALPSLAMPDGVYLPLSTEYPKRDVKGARPKSIFHLPPSKPPRQKAEQVGAFVFSCVFSNQSEVAPKETVLEV